VAKRKGNVSEPSDARELGAYGVPEAARLLNIPRSTLRSWVVGRKYPTGSGLKFFAPLIPLADPRDRLLSFVNLVEAHVLDAIRREHAVALPKVRQAIAYLRTRFPSKHPLAALSATEHSLSGRPRR
jgi:hypothetical protein